MNDSELIALYDARNETAIKETSLKYGAYLHSIARRILGDAESAEECVNDALYKAWLSIPPAHPEKLGAWIGRLTRNISLNRVKHISAQKRGGGETDAAFEEIESFIPSFGEDFSESIALKAALNTFLAELKKEERCIFVQRYWYFLSIDEIAAENGIKKSKVKTSLFRTRNKLRIFLEKEGLFK